MKNITRIFGTFLFILSISSCSGFLDECPTTTLSDETAFTTEADLEAQLVGCFNSLHGTGLWKGTMNEFFHTASGLMIWKNKRNMDDWLDGLLFAKYSTNGFGNKNIFGDLYSGIRRCNVLLEHLETSTVDDAFKNEIKAETLFYRGILFFTVARIFGDAPLPLKPSTAKENTDLPRVAWYKVYIQALEDLDFAEKNMRDKRRQEEVNPEKNRPYNWAATAVKATVYLHLGTLLAHPDDNFWNPQLDAELVQSGKDPRTPDFSPVGIRSAEDAFRLAHDTACDVIDNSCYSLCANYSQLFRWREHEDWFLPEGILVFTSNNQSGGNLNSVRMLPQYCPYCESTSETNSNWGRVRPSRWAIDNFIKYSGGEVYEGQQLEACGLYYDTKDPRYDISFLYNFVNSQGSRIKTYPDPSKITSTSSSTYLPYCRKYLDHTFRVGNGNASFYYLRLAEMYLIAAEAAANLSSGPGDAWWNDAIRNVNVIRSRARASFLLMSDEEKAEKGEIERIGDAPQPADWSASTFSTKDELIYGIFWERYLELNCEGHEWFDTHRMGATWLSKYIAEPLNNFYCDNEFQQDFVFSVFANYIMAESETIYEEDPVQLRKSLINSFPENELRLNKAIDEQNDFYWK